MGLHKNRKHFEPKNAFGGDEFEIKRLFGSDIATGGDHSNVYVMFLYRILMFYLEIVQVQAFKGRSFYLRYTRTNII